MARRRSGKSEKRSRGGSVGWKKSKALAIGLILVIIVFWIYIIKNALVGPSRPPLLTDFPYQFMTEKTHKLIEIRCDSDKQPKVPFKQDGSDEYVWEAWVCKNEKCPWLRAVKNKEKKPYIFPNINEFQRKVAEGEIDPNNMGGGEGEEGGGMPEEFYHDQMPECPVCKQAGLEDSFNVDRYQTEEGLKKLDDLRKKYQEEKNK